MQDRAQKAAALRYTVTKRWFPQLEILVLPQIRTSRANKAVTDIDVLALMPDDFDGFRSILIDCKTRKNESPISRALWQRGLIDQFGATRGICILKRDAIEEDHRYSASQFGVLLLAESEFDEFARSTGGVDLEHNSHVANIELWDKYLSLPGKYPNLKDLINLVFSGHWMSPTPSEACRKSIAAVKTLRTELDPGKLFHVFLVGDICSIFMESIARIATKIFAGYLKPTERNKLSEALLPILYGGKEAYEYRNRILKLIRQPQPKISHDGESEPTKIPELSPPEWNMFLELIRSCLESPTETPKTPLLLREIGFAALAESSDYSFAGTLGLESPHSVRLAMAGIEYLCKASGLPPEFAEHYSAVLMKL